jgi:hypothetical protein
MPNGPVVNVAKSDGIKEFRAVFNIEDDSSKKCYLLVAF